MKPIACAGVLALIAALPLAADAEAWPETPPRGGKLDEFDAVIVGGGLGGLSAAAAFARQGYRALVVERHDRPGGYATAFRRPGGFTFTPQGILHGADEATRAAFNARRKPGDMRRWTGVGVDTYKPLRPSDAFARLTAT